MPKAQSFDWQLFRKAYLRSSVRKRYSRWAVLHVWWNNEAWLTKDQFRVVDAAPESNSGMTTRPRPQIYKGFLILAEDKDG